MVFTLDLRNKSITRLTGSKGDALRDLLPGSFNVFNFGLHS